MILLLLLNSLWIMGVYASFQEGNIFWKLNPYRYIVPMDYYSGLHPAKEFLYQIFKPIIGCPVCMASVHGILFLLFFQEFITETKFISLFDYKQVIFYIFALAGTNRVIVKIADI